MAIQIGKYKRPGIFIEEYDNSIISSPVVDGITNMVIGVSKKGPINTPIRLTTINDLESVFGQLDRGLERKGSFFHRTIQKMLETSPVYAINLLSTDDTLDTIEYKSISSSSGYSNDMKREGPYRRFFDTTGFWKRDTESFINLTVNNTGYSERAFNLTNLSDRYVTVFVVKSSRTGFDRTLIEWYGSQEKLPPYVNSNDYASDYLVDVIIVGGDWSNYENLSIDNRWSAYFNSTGLVKSQLRSFANDRNVTLLGYYEGLSLIPYFRDSNGTNIFIETIINRDTDKTGIFCAFNSELVETEYYNGLLDLIGNTLAGTNTSSIDFLSYNDTISESIEITAVPLDLPGNVTAILGGSYSYISQGLHAFGTTPSTSGIISNTNRTAYFGEGFTYHLKYTSATSASASITVEYDTTQGDAFAVIGDTKIELSGTASLVINASDYNVSSATLSFASVFVLDSTGEISVINNLTGKSSNPTLPTVDASDIVLGYATFSMINQQIIPSSFSINHVNVDVSGFVDFTFGSSNSDYYIATSSVAGQIQVTFIDTNGTAATNNYDQYRRIKMFNRLIGLIDSPNKDLMTLSLGASSSKVSLSTMTISDIVTTTTEDKSFKLNTGLSDSDLVNILKGYFVIYTEDNEFILGSNLVTQKSTIATSTEGVVSRYSDLYTNYYNGVVNTGDYFYSNKLNGTESVNITLISMTGSSYVIFENMTSTFATDDEFIIPDSILNTGTFTIINDSASLAAQIGYSGQKAYEVLEDVTAETLSNISTIYDVLSSGNDGRRYLRMYIDDSNILRVDFMDSEFSATASVNITANNTFFIQSSKSNYKQTIEIEVPSGYTQVNNKILVNGSRYTEVKVGDFLSADYDVSLLVTGEMPRKLTRILSKRQYSGDISLVEITCDSAIKKTSIEGDLQTTRYTSIDNYVNTYKAISLEGFRIRTDSMPDGTETRQTQILNLVAKGTPLFKAITNKEAIDFRYLVDSFGLGLIERSKQQLVDICGERLDALGIINMPSMKSFKNSSSPSFVDSEGVLQMEFVSKGGDPESSPAFLYSFGDGVGVSSVGYFLPYLVVSDNGRPVDVPPAAWVATTYMRKHTANISGVTPWTIAAGVTNGRITNITSTEMSFTNEDIEWLNGAQMNPIVFKRNRGNVIETENTSQTLYKSALSYLHVREVLIELERELSRMLLDFQWKYNTPDIRAEIKLRADVICETYVSKNGLYNYFNKMDEENNTSEVIDNQMGILDTYVEPIRGMGIIVNNITILRTGSINAGGFING